MEGVAFADFVGEGVDFVWGVVVEVVFEEVEEGEEVGWGEVLGEEFGVGGGLGGCGGSCHEVDILVRCWTEIRYADGLIQIVTMSLVDWLGQEERSLELCILKPSYVHQPAACQLLLTKPPSINLLDNDTIDAIITLYVLHCMYCTVDAVLRDEREAQLLASQ